MKLLGLLLLSLWGMLALAVPARAQAPAGNPPVEVLSGWDDEDAPADDPRTEADKTARIARVRLNDREYYAGASEIELPNATRMTLHVDRLRPLTYVRVDIQKTGMKLETRRYRANHLGELILAFTTPKKNIGATAKVHYTAAAGNDVQQQIRVKFR